MKMKKLIVFAIAVVAVVVAQAASFTWSASQVRNGWDGGANKVDGATAYLFLVGANSASESAVASAISSAASSSALASTLGGMSIDSTTVATGVIEGTSGDVSATAPASLFMVVISGDNVYQSAAISVSEIETLGATTVAFGSQKTASMSASAWSTVGGGSGGTPEPTSGLLLLVGGAMLALRRKQK